MLARLKDNAPEIGAVSGVVLALGVVMQLVVVGPMNRGFDTVDNRFDDLRAEMNQRFGDLRAEARGRFDDFSAEARGRFDDFSAEVRGRFESVDQRFDDMNRSVNQRLDDLKANMAQRFDAQDERLDQLTDQLSELRRLTTGIGERVSLNEGQIRVIVDQLRAADTSDPQAP